MARPHPYFQLSTRAERVDSQSSREDRFGPWKEIIYQRYVQQRTPLNKLMRQMRQEYGLDQTPKQWKTQLGVWGFKLHHGIKDAAHMLRCLNQARSLGHQDAVMFSGQLRRREHIMRYIQRSKVIVDEQDLLSRIAPGDPTPKHIVPLTLEHTPPLSGSPGSLVAGTVSAEISPMISNIPSPVNTPRSSEEYLRRSDALGEASRLGHLSRDEPQHTSPHSGSLMTENKYEAGPNAIPELGMPFMQPNRRTEPVAPRGRDSAKSAATLPMDVMIAAMSADPIDLTKMGVTPTHDRYSLGFDSVARGDYSRCRQVTDNNSYAALFVDHSMYWCYCVGQNDPTYQRHAEYHLGTARFFFLGMLQDTCSPGERCLEAMSIVTTLFDCLGHTQKLLKILAVCDEDTRKHFGTGNPLTETIAFKKNFLERRERGTGPMHDLQHLRAIFEGTRQRYPDSPGPILTAWYNWAWAMLEMKQYAAARDELEAITARTRAHFGDDHLQTIMAAATLARATLYCGDAEGARQIIMNHVCPSVRNNFPSQHPYTWEANHRQAFFLHRLAMEADEQGRDEYLWKAEDLLREVVIQRHRVLGNSNPKSVHSFRLLKQILEQQGKVKDAQNLWAWCQYKLKRQDSVNELDLPD